MADLSITAASVVPGTGARTATGTAGETLTAGQPIYLKSADSRLWRADANASAATAVAKGIALHGASAGQPLTYVTSGDLNPGATATVGKLYVVSANAGGIAPVDDLASGHYVTVLGIGTTSTNIAVGVKSYGVALA